MSSHVGRWAMAGIVGLAAFAAPAEDAAVLSFANGELPSNLKQNNVDARVVTHNGAPALEVQYRVADWPNVLFSAPEGGWDWSGYAGIEIALHNPTDESIHACLRVDNAGADGMNHCNNGSTVVPAHEDALLTVRFNTGVDGEFWGMRGLPVRGPSGSGPVMDTSKIVAFQIFVPMPSDPHTLIVKGAKLFGQGGSLRELVPLPFVDRFGQYMHETWPGKLVNESEFETRRVAEEAAWAQSPALPGRDEFGGWADGPQLDATGWFRTELVKGKWWLVTPSGHLFFSNGVDCVATWERTWV
ncbi:MAG: hypothetical protein QG656_2714, partial [Candidatus Hydrogenedentes bacterium]|nr:hypothetical protein [Candidatus Hydrogenedentota bacterium]